MKKPGWCLALTREWNPLEPAKTAKQLIAREFKHEPGTINILIDCAIKSGLLHPDERQWLGSDFDVLVGYCWAHLT